MSGVNKVILIGRLGKDPEMRYMPNGNAVANFSLATSEQFKDRDGNKQDRVEWHKVVLFGRTAEVAGEYLRKGGMAYIEGRLQTRKWTDKDGQERHTTEIVGDRMQLLGGKGDDRDRSNNADESAYRRASSGSAKAGESEYRRAFYDSTGPEPKIDFDDDIPF